MRPTLHEMRPLRALTFGKRAIKVFKMCMIYHLYNTFPSQTTQGVGYMP